MSQRTVVGIDLGTTLTKVARVHSRGVPVSIPNSERQIGTPSVIHFKGAEIVVGREAREAAVLCPGQTVSCIKREMGNKHFVWEWSGRRYAPEELSALILKKVLQDTERHLGRRVDAAVITVPAYFDDARRKATQDAGTIAGVEVLDIINEPTAAALAYGIHKERSLQTVLVYDLGGGTFDVSLVQFDGYDLRVLATEGDIRLGGRDWDERIVNHVSGKFMAEHGQDPRQDPRAYQELIFLVEESKKALSSHTAVKLRVEAFGRALDVNLTRDHFENLTSDLLARTEGTCKLVLMDAGLEWSDVDRILLVGGSSKMPMVVGLLSRFGVCHVEDHLSSDVIVSHGAAAYAALLESRRGQAPRPIGNGLTVAKPTAKRVEEAVEPTIEISAPAWMRRARVTNVNSHSLGILARSRKVGEKRNIVLIPKNTPLPHSAKRRFHTAADGQTHVDIRVLEGESSDPDKCVLIGRCRISGLPGNASRGLPVDVKCTYETNGRLTVTASVPEYNLDAGIALLREQGLSDDQLASARDAAGRAIVR